MCGGPGMDMKISSTIGFERRHNPTLSLEDEDHFVEAALAGLGPQPPNFEAIVNLNKGPLLTQGVELLPLAPRQVEQKRAGGAMVVDVRTDRQFDDAHIPGAISIPMLRAGFGSKLRGSPIAGRTSCSWVATTRTAAAPVSSPSRSESAGSRAFCTAA